MYPLLADPANQPLPALIDVQLYELIKKNDLASAVNLIGIIRTKVTQSLREWAAKPLKDGVLNLDTSNQQQFINNFMRGVIYISDVRGKIPADYLKPLPESPLKQELLTILNDINTTAKTDKEKNDDKTDGEEPAVIFSQIVSVMKKLYVLFRKKNKNIDEEKEQETQALNFIEKFRKLPVSYLTVFLQIFMK